MEPVEFEGIETVEFEGIAPGNDTIRILTCYEEDIVGRWFVVVIGEH